MDQIFYKKCYSSPSQHLLLTGEPEDEQKPVWFLLILRQKSAKNYAAPGKARWLIKYIAYEPVQVFTLIWWPQRCKNSSLLIWIWWYPIIWLNIFSWSQIFDGVSCFSWWFSIFTGKNCFVSRNVGKRLFFWQQWNCIVQLQKKSSHNFWWNFMSVCSEMLRRSALQ